MRLLQRKLAALLPARFSISRDHMVSANGSSQMVFAALPARYPPASDGALAFDSGGRFGYRMLAATGQRSGLEALRAVLAEALPLDQERVLEWRVWLAFWGSAATSARLQAEQHRRYREWRGLLKRVLAAAQQDGQLSASIDLDRLVDQIVALVDGFGLQGVLDPQHPQPEQLASRPNDAVDALIRSAEV